MDKNKIGKHLNGILEVSFLISPDVWIDEMVPGLSCYPELIVAEKETEVASSGECI